MSEATQTIIEPEQDIVVGLKGHLGVRYGVSFSIVHANEDGIVEKHEVASAEIDTLDVTIQQFGPLEANSKILYCLLKKLTDTEEFKLVSRYICSTRKAVAMTALYNDLGFLKSIGQTTVKWLASGTASTPGVSVSVDTSTGEVTYTRNAGWESIVTRNAEARGTWFVTTWDEWDQELLRNSRSTLKRLFKGYYNSRTFDISRALEDVNPFGMAMRNLKARFTPASGKRVLPKWSRSKITGNPFDAKGNLCEK